jgi:hypothetical protein
MNEMFASVSLGSMMLVDIFLCRRSICLRPVVQYEHVLKDLVMTVCCYMLFETWRIGISGSCYDESSRCRLGCLDMYILLIQLGI